MTPASSLSKKAFDRLLEAADNLPMGSLRKRSVQLSGHATSLALEPEFWAVLEAMARADGLSLPLLIARIDEARGARPLASACRVAALGFSGRG